jgi:two-component system alkaline phosphatase synthesis response regulator PhoP
LILVVDDDPDILALLVEVLSGRGYRVATAEDGLGALESARAFLPSLIVLDLMLPRMTALEFRREQQRDETLRHVPVVCLSAASHAQTVAFELGVDSCLEKPLDMERLLAIVRSHCGSPPAV